MVKSLKTRYLRTRQLVAVNFKHWALICAIYCSLCLGIDANAATPVSRGTMASVALLSACILWCLEKLCCRVFHSISTTATHQ